MFVIYILATEIVGVLLLFGTLTKIKLSTLGMTILAWGSSVADLVANVTITKLGFQRTAYSACFGGPLFSILCLKTVCLVEKNVALTIW